jgi:hypothetical protein
LDEQHSSAEDKVSMKRRSPVMVLVLLICLVLVVVLEPMLRNN